MHRNSHLRGDTSAEFPSGTVRPPLIVARLTRAFFVSGDEKGRAQKLISARPSSCCAQPVDVLRFSRATGLGLPRGVWFRSWRAFAPCQSHRKQGRSHPGVGLPNGPLWARRVIPSVPSSRSFR